MIKIGYQGEVGSNSEAAAEMFVKQNNLKYGEYELIPLVESRCVVDSMKSKQIDFGVMAIQNSIAGIVKETYDAARGERLEVVQTIILPIHHCLFIKQNLSLDNIDTVISHVQALAQTQQNRKYRFPRLTERATSDTACTARMLSENELPDNFAIICRKKAGEMYNLKLIAENIEDARDNRTEFGIFRYNTIMNPII